MMEALARNPVDSIPRACEGWAQTKGAYRWLENERVKVYHLNKAIKDTAARKCKGEKTVLAVQDTTVLSYNKALETKGLGCTQTPGSRGMLLHTTLAVREDGLPLGALEIDIWNRDREEYGKKKNRKQLPIEEKESGKWLRGVHSVSETLSALPEDERPRVIHVCDREADIMEMYTHCGEHGAGMVIRGTHNRYVKNEAGEVGKAFAMLRRQPPRYTERIAVPRKRGQPAREATVEVRAQRYTLCDRTGNDEGVSLNLVEVVEVHPPEGVTPLLWRLWTTEPIQTREQIQRVIGIYKCRWRIEEYHRTLKSCCRVEVLRLKKTAGLKKATVLYATLAIRIMQLRDIARLAPDAPCTRVLSEEEWKTLWILTHKKPPKKGTPPPTIKQATLWIGGLGGHLGRKGDGMPGVQTLCKGLCDLGVAVRLYVLFSEFVE